jgi:hypothetical protein
MSRSIQVLIVVLMLLFNGMCYADKKPYTYGTAANTALSVTHTGGPYNRTLKEVRFHLASAPTTSENFIISIDSGLGSEYDCVIVSEDMQSATDLYYAPVNPIELTDPNDKFKFTYTNTDIIMYGLEVLYE